MDRRGGLIQLYALRPDGTVTAIDSPAVKREFAETRLDRRKPDYLINNDPASCADLVLNGDVKAYPDAVRQGE